MANEFKGKVALVTGGSSGIGRSTALAFAQNGARVAIVDRDQDKGREVERKIREAGGDALFIPCDVSDPEEVKQMTGKVADHFGRIDFAFNNAGIEGETAFTESCTQENWDRVININLRGIWLCMKYQIPVMLNQGGGVIVNCSSVAGHQGFAGSPAYVASKHGIIGLTKAASLENAARGIRVNAVSPGVIHTPMIDRVTDSNPEMEEMLTGMEPMKRMGNPEEIASAVLWLCSEGAGFVTGHSLVVDGGVLAG